MTANQSVSSSPPSSLPPFLVLSFLSLLITINYSLYRSLCTRQKRLVCSGNSAVLLLTTEGSDASNLADISPRREQNSSSTPGLPSSPPTSQDHIPFAVDILSLPEESCLYSLSISLYSTSSFQSTALKSCYSVIACDLFLISLGFSDYE